MKHLVLGISILLCAVAGSGAIAEPTYGDNACNDRLSKIAREAKLGEELFWTFAVVGDTVPQGLLSYSFLAGPNRQPTALALIGSPAPGGCNAAQVGVNYDPRSCAEIRREMEREPGIRVSYSSDNATVLSGSPLNPTTLTLLRGGTGCVLVGQHAGSYEKTVKPSGGTASPEPPKRRTP